MVTFKAGALSKELSRRGRSGRDLAHAARLSRGTMARLYAGLPVSPRVALKVNAYLRATSILEEILPLIESVS